MPSQHFGSVAARRRIAALASTLIVALSLLAAPGYGQVQRPQAPAETQAVTADKLATDTYIVQFRAEPAASFKGNPARGLARTAPQRGDRLHAGSPAVREYVSFLRGRHNRVLDAAGVARSDKLYSYTYAFNGVAAVLAGAEAARLERRPDVLRVERQQIHQLHTDSSPDFLGLTGEDGLWSRFEPGPPPGSGMIVGVIDTGVWPEHPSFSDRRRPNLPPSDSNPLSFPDPPDYWRGACEFGEDFGPKDCNNKLIGARYFNEGFYGPDGPGADAQDYQSPRDHDGHGSHTMATAAGRRGVQAAVLGNPLGRISGMAPRARVAAYKVCWEGIGCATADLVAAIDSAVADGVDVINYSIGSPDASILGAVEVAFLFAHRAGVFVAQSAGNAGPGVATIGSASIPWATTVAASTQERSFEGEVILGSGERYEGVTLTRGTARLPLVDAEDYGNPLCNPGEFTDAGELAGTIVLCERGVIARVAKSLAVDEVGGAGMVLWNPTPDASLNTDNHYVPSLHVDSVAGQAIKGYIDSAESPTARLTGGEKVFDGGGNVMASFSSRGPNRAAPDMIKPDVTAPGVNILAANTPTAFLGAPGQLFQAISGTSMSSPHVAGIATLLKQRNPSWTPDMVKSALMTTARQNLTKEDGTTPADPFDFGAGHIDPLPATRPGLVYKAGYNDYLQFIQGAGLLDLGIEGIDPSDLNLASIGVADLAGRQTVSRTVTNVGERAEYVARVDAPAGVDVEVSPSRISPRGGTSQDIEITFTSNDEVTFDEYAFGSITWVGSNGVEVYSPIAVRPVRLAAPDEIQGTGASGSQTYEIAFGYTGDFLAAPRGLEPATEFEGNVVDDPNNQFVSPDQVGVTVHEVEVAEGTEYTRFSLFDDAVDGEDDDLDLYIFDSEGNFVGGSGSPTSDEQVDLDDPAPGTYTVAVHGWETDGPDANYTLFNWQIGDAAAGNMTVDAPTQAVLGETADVTVTWDALANGRWMGAVTYHDDASAVGYRDNLIGETLVRVDVGEGQDSGG